MKLRCVICEHTQEAEHLAVACGGCGARGAMQVVATNAGLRPGEPVVGPSRVPITRGRESALRGADEEPLEVTRARNKRRLELVAAGLSLSEARQKAVEDVPIQCGRCGGEDRACPVCRGRAMAPTDKLRQERAGAGERRGSRRTTKRPPGRVARVSE